MKQMNIANDAISRTLNALQLRFCVDWIIWAAKLLGSNGRDSIEI